MQRYLGFINFYKKYTPRMTGKLNLVYKLSKAEMQLNITSELEGAFDSVSKAFSVACEPALEQRSPGKQLLLLTDASFRSAAYALTTEDNPGNVIQSKRKTSDQKFPPLHNSSTRIFEGSFDNLHGFSRVCSDYLRDDGLDCCPDR